MIPDSDIEALKVHKIEPPRDKKRLPTVSNSSSSADLVEDARQLPVMSSDAKERAEIASDAETKERVVQTLRSIFDPEIPLNIYDLGLIYGIDTSNGEVSIQMTLTAPACPVAGELVNDVTTRVGKMACVTQAHVALVWDPPWTKEKMSEEALFELGLL